MLQPVIRAFLAIIFIFYFAGARAQDSLLYPSLNPGTAAPCFKGKNENGKVICLERVKSRFTLLYFYEVHCHLCELVTPQLKKLYDGYRNTGLEVIAIAAGSSRDEWLGYVRDQSLSWKNVHLSGKHVDALKADYKLTVSPTMYLLDSEKILLTQRMGRIEQVEEELNRLIR
jgi:hypothetical protein